MGADANLTNNRSCVELSIPESPQSDGLAVRGPWPSLGAWGGVVMPVGALAEGAKTGTGFGADAGIQVTPTVGLYGGYSSSSFGCERVLDSLGGRCVETDIRGFDAGVRGQFPLGMVAPFLQAGLVYHTVVTECVGLGDGRVSGCEGLARTSSRSLGYQAGGGLEVALGRMLAIYPRLVYTLRAGNGGRAATNDVRADAGIRIWLGR